MSLNTRLNNKMIFKKVPLLLISPFSAIPSWEGYEYQGHIAIFVVLREINSLLKNSIDINASKYLLEIEGAEDFSIKDGDKYLTLHQVKYGALALENKDKFCFLISILQYEAQKGYFHITSAKALPDDFTKVTSDTIKTLKNEFDGVIRNKNINISSDGQKQAEEDCIIIEAITANSAKGSKYSILRHVLSSMKLEVNEDNIKKAIDRIKSELAEYEQKILVNETTADDSTFVSVYDELFDYASDVKLNCPLCQDKNFRNHREP